ncbi:MAG: hypothetical protein L6R39_004768, partial [Caloplaca ligustica]
MPYHLLPRQQHTKDVLFRYPNNYKYNVGPHNIDIRNRVRSRARALSPPLVTETQESSTRRRAISPLRAADYSTIHTPMFWWVFATCLALLILYAFYIASTRLRHPDRSPLPQKKKQAIDPADCATVDEKGTQKWGIA